MSSSLFDLISLAGSASLDEIRARSPVDEKALANSVATMATANMVALSVTPGYETVPTLKQVIYRLQMAAGLTNAPAGDRGVLKEAIQAVLETKDAATFVTASPTSRGFKSFL